MLKWLSWIILIGPLLQIILFLEVCGCYMYLFILKCKLIEELICVFWRQRSWIHLQDCIYINLIMITSLFVWMINDKR